MTFRKIGEVAVHSPNRKLALLMVVVLFFVSVTAFAKPSKSYDLVIKDGEKVISLSTSETDAEKILEEQDVLFNEAYGDKLDLTEFKAGEDGSVITINRGVSVSITNYDGSTYAVFASGTVTDAIKAAEIKLPEGASVNYSLDEPLSEGMEVEIYGAYDIKIKINGAVYERTVSGKTVGDAISKVDLNISDDDYTKPSESTPLMNGIEIEVVKVTTKTYTVTETLSYTTKYVYTDTLAAGKTRVKVEGQNGIREIVYKESYIDGVLINSVVKETKITKRPVDKVLEVGTKANIKPSTTPSSTPISDLAVPSYVNIGANGVPTSYKKAINAKATAYCIPGGITSTGEKVRTGYIAVDPNEIPYGTEMYIVSADGKRVYGYCIAADTGGFVNSTDWTVDLYMDTEQECVNWGRRDIIIYIL
ncbi:MAG: G5 domain-containing protein [Clostridia bacterium]|nr:G5 domain-containing protein [Clostridia bacterium]